MSEQQQQPEALKPCPFCGGPAILFYNNAVMASVETRSAVKFGAGPFIQCRDCHVEIDEFATEGAAISAWNRRVPSPSGEGRNQ